MQITHRIIGTFAPVAIATCGASQVVQQSSPLSAWQSYRMYEQILELKQQIETTNASDNRRVKNLQTKLKKLERQQALTKPTSTLDPTAPAWSPPSSVASPSTTSSSTINAAAPEWTPPNSPAVEPSTLPFALFPAPSLPTPSPTPPPVEPKTVRFNIPTPEDHSQCEESWWDLVGLNPCTHRLLGGDLLDAIDELGDSF